MHLARVILLSAVALAAGCGGGGKKDSSHETSIGVATESGPAETSATNETGASKPIGCLDAAGLSSVEGRGVGLWSGRHENPAYRIVVHKLARPARAPRVVAGEYAITGSFKVVAVARGLRGNDGIQADALVQIVADCLGG